jgi:magnesium transporter
MKVKKLSPEKMLRYLYQPAQFGTERTKEILDFNPNIIPQREEARDVKIYVYDFDAETISELHHSDIRETFPFKNSPRVSWINIDGIRKADVEMLCEYYGIHTLVVEDILSINQRPKMEEIEGVMFCLLNMLYFNEETKEVETEQISIVLGENFVISFQEDATRDVFDPIRVRLKLSGSKIRQRSADYLNYSLLDMIVDNYFTVMERLSDQLEDLEEEVIRKSNNRSLAKINKLRKELIVLKRNIGPVRDLVNGFVKSESDLLEERHEKYYKDVYDHIIQAYDLSENYRDMVMSLQDLYISQVSLKMNEVMKVMAIVTCLLAPATVIGGIFGMNFDIIPYKHYTWGFYLAVAVMLFIPFWMLFVFRKRGWF